MKEERGNVRCFGLDYAHVDLFGVGDLVVVEDVVLEGGTVQPDWALTLDQDAASVVEINLFMVVEI